MHRFNQGNDNPILNDTLLQEAYEAGRRQALQEMNGNIHPPFTVRPNGGLDFTPPPGGRPQGDYRSNPVAAINKELDGISPRR